MKWIDRIVGRRRIYDDLNEEIRAHLEEKTEALVRNGMSRGDARAAARPCQASCGLALAL